MQNLLQNSCGFTASHVLKRSDQWPWSCGVISTFSFVFKHLIGDGTNNSKHTPIKLGQFRFRVRVGVYRVGVELGVALGLGLGLAFMTYDEMSHPTCPLFCYSL